MQSEPTWTPFFASPELRQKYLSRYNIEYGVFHHPEWTAKAVDLCACGNMIGRFPEGIRIRSYTDPVTNQWTPQIAHTNEGCYLSEAELQMECEGPYRKDTGAYVGCSNCEPYVRLAETRDSAYLYGVQFNDFSYQVYDGDNPVEGVLEVKVGMGGYIIQVRRTPDAHHCPCYLAEDDEEIQPKICRLYLPGNNYRVEEQDAD
jgi:hypothetical protein